MKDELIMVRVDAAEKARIKKRAQAAGFSSVSEYLRVLAAKGGRRENEPITKKGAGT